MISIHAPLTGCDSTLPLRLMPFTSFQSTHPLRDATLFFLQHYNIIIYFNPRTPYGMRRKALRNRQQRRKISIHAPLTGCDAVYQALTTRTQYFNPRTPYGMRLVLCITLSASFIISIHAPLTGCDWKH